MTFMSSIIAAMQNLSLEDTPKNTLVSQAIMDPLKSNSFISFQDYLSFTSTCVTFGANRFGSVSKMGILNDLVNRVIVKDHHWTVAWAFDNSEKMAFIHRLFPAKSYVTRLSITCPAEAAIDYVALNIILQKFPNTKTLILPMEEWVNHEHFVSCVNTCKNLTTLTVPHHASAADYLNINWDKPIRQLIISRDVREEGVEKIFNSCKQIEELFFSFTKNLGEFFFLRTDFPATLRSLSFIEAKITDRALIKIVKSCSKLTSLTIQRCPYISQRGVDKAESLSNIKISFEKCRRVIHAGRFRHHTGIGYV